MKKLLLTVIAISTLILTGCAVNQTQAQRESENMKKIGAETQVLEKACNDEINSLDSSKVVFSQILVQRASSPNKFDLMASKDKLNEFQKSALKEFIASNEKCREIKISGLSKISVNLVAAFRTYYAKNDAIFLALLKGDFTIGDANVAKEKAYNELTIDINQASTADQQRLDAMHNNEINQRQQAAAIMLPYLMQQQAIQAQQQQNIYNQQMQQIQRNTPVYRPPVNTTCTAIGNQINCTSQ